MRYMTDTIHLIFTTHWQTRVARNEVGQRVRQCRAVDHARRPYTKSELGTREESMNLQPEYLSGY
jgi:hypothetical protein